MYQVKFHQKPSVSKAFADSINELKKIEEYRKKGNHREPQWRGVDRWCLVTNADFNPTDNHRWNSEIVPLFKEKGLTAEYWERAKIDALLVKYPEVDQSYFGGKRRIFLSIQEGIEHFSKQERYLKRDSLGAFIGRKEEINEIEEFLESDKRFLVIHGTGGIGKTRLALEAGAQIASNGKWQVLWAYVNSMEATGTWFQSVVPERPTLLIVDEPENEKILKILTEQLSGRMSQWKILVSIRSPKDPLINYFSSSSVEADVHKIDLLALSDDDARLMCADIIRKGKLAKKAKEWRDEVAKEIAKRFGNHPVWITLAISLLESTGDLTRVPQSSEKLAKEYLDEIIRGQSDYRPELLMELLRWVSLAGSINREDDTIIKLIANQTGFKKPNDLKKALSILVKRRVLSERGAWNRFVEIKPDVLRDYLLSDWLITDLGYGSNPFQVSEVVPEIVQIVVNAVLSDTVNDSIHSILVSLIRTEFLYMSGQEISLMDSFWEKTKTIASSPSVSLRIRLAELLTHIAAYYPLNSAESIRKLRQKPVSRERIENIMGVQEVDRRELILELAWPLFHAAFGAKSIQERECILIEFCHLVEEEAKIEKENDHGLPNDGKRAKALLNRVVNGGPEFRTDFSDAAEKVGLQLLDESVGSGLPEARMAAIKALICPSLCLKRDQTWSDDSKFYINQIGILPGHTAWKTRKSLKEKIKKFLEGECTPDNIRVDLWELLSASHLNQAPMLEEESTNIKSVIREELLNDLKWTRMIISAKPRSIKELKAARMLWNRHKEVKEDQDLKSISEELESIYQRNDVIAEFEWLQSRDNWDLMNERAVEKADRLAVEGCDKIALFLKRAISFYGEDRLSNEIFGVAFSLGKHAEKHSNVQDFIFSVFGSTYGAVESKFASVVAESWVSTLRQSDPLLAYNLVLKISESCISDNHKINFIFRMYGQYGRPDTFGIISDKEYEFIRSQEELFVKNSRIESFVSCVAWGVDYNFPQLQSQIVGILENIQGDLLVNCINILVDTLQFNFHISNRIKNSVPPGLGIWVLNQVIRLPRIDSHGGNLKWHVLELLKVTGKAPARWLPEAVKRRKRYEDKYDSDDFFSHFTYDWMVEFILPVEQDTESDRRAVVCEILGFIHDNGSISGSLQKLLFGIDPNGTWVAPEIAERLSKTKNHKEIRRMARLGSMYPQGTEAWRRIAKPVLEIARNTSEEDRKGMYSVLDDGGIRSYGWNTGGVPPIIRHDMESAQKNLDDEADPIFQHFWKWKINVATERFKYYEQIAKEDQEK